MSISVWAPVRRHCALCEVCTEEGFIQKSWQRSSLLPGEQNWLNSLPRYLFFTRKIWRIGWFLFFKSSWCNSSYSSYRPGAIRSILNPPTPNGLSSWCNYSYSSYSPSSVHPILHIVQVQFVIFFISSWCNASYSSYRSGAIRPILLIFLVQFILFYGSVHHKWLRKLHPYRLVPWLGSGLYLVNGSAQRTDLARSLLLKWYRTHGPIIRVKQFGQNIVYVVESDDIRELPLCSFR